MDSAKVERLFERIKSDFRWACANVYYITDRDNNKRHLVFGRVQRVVHKTVEDMEAQGLPVLLIILKGRQFGVSTYFCLRAVHKFRWFAKNCLTLAHREGPGKIMFGKIERALDSLPEELQPQYKSSLEGNLRVARRLDSLVKRESAEVIDAGVSETYQVCHLTELPLWRDSTATMAGFLPTVKKTAGSQIVLEFTARAAHTYEHQQWLDAKAGRSIFRALFLAWYWHEEYSRPRDDLMDHAFTPAELDYRAFVAKQGVPYPLRTDKAGNDHWITPPPAQGVRLTDEQLLWVRDQVNGFKGDWNLFFREFPATDTQAFQASGRRVIPPTVMDAMQLHERPPLIRGEFETFTHHGRTSPRFVDRDDGEVWIFEKPKPGAFYLIDIDVSSGAGLDATGLHVLRIERSRYTVVASFQGRRPVHDVARLASRLGRAYRDGAESDPHNSGVVTLGTGRACEIIPERNGFGEHLIHELVHNLGYKRVYRHTDKSRDNYSKGHDYGFPTTVHSKMPMIQNLVQVCFEGRLVCPDSRTLSELRNMIYLDDQDRQAGAPPGENSHDDMAMAIGIGCRRAVDMTQGKRRDVEHPNSRRRRYRPGTRTSQHAHESDLPNLRPSPARDTMPFDDESMISPSIGR